MKYPPSRTRGLRPMKALETGEGSRTYRVRAPDAVHEWLSGMTAEERGQMLAEVHARSTRSTAPQQPARRASRQSSKPRATLAELEARFPKPEGAGLPATVPAEAGIGQGASVLLQGPSRPAGEELRLSGAVPTRLSAYALAVVEDLQRGGVLVQDGQVYRLTVDGHTRTVRGDTVYGLRRAGVLVETGE